MSKDIVYVVLLTWISQNPVSKRFVAVTVILA